ncbi:PilZ domain-containing protein [Methylobacterium sp. NI91]|nr:MULTISPECIES: PilZ domain-containing protein [unclassified Methylobacterium]QIJ77300.1 PilZ domain-containing protein [Methylobacterium sp. CLZ]QIJ82204.1 PilZ domain-containing protein [Methylobacterium sp. NI91]
MSGHSGFRFDQAQIAGGAGLIAVDEHTSIGCWVHGISAQDIEITVPDTSLIPDVFMLTSSPLDPLKVCCTLWRTDETIGARFR